MKVGKKTLFIGLTAALVLLSIELVTAVALGLHEGRATWPSRLQRERELITGDESGQPLDHNATETETARWFVNMLEEHVLHPYLGFVQDPDRDSAAKRWKLDEQAGEYGFPRNFHPLFDEASGRSLVVAVVGGSVSRQIGFGGNRSLRAGLARIPRFEGRDIRVLSLGLGGFKQPQQLMTFSYLLSLGMKIDVLINIDGFNEVVLPVTENVPLGVNPFFPRGWAFWVEDLDQENRRIRGEVTLLRERRRRFAHFFSRVPLRYSATASLVWRLGDRRIVRTMHEREIELVKLESEGGSYQGRGPAARYADQGALFGALVDVWFRSSLHLNRLATANGIEYYHFLQPNQYDEGSKELTIEERRSAWDDNAPALSPVSIGYPLLRAKGAFLRDENVRFVDLSSAFRDVRETAYIDRCCHYNELGIGIVVDMIVETIAAGGPVTTDQSSVDGDS